MLQLHYHIHIVSLAAIRIRGIQLRVVAINHAALRQLEVVQMDLVVLIEEVLAVFHRLADFALLTQQLLVASVPSLQFGQVDGFRNATAHGNRPWLLSVHKFTFISMLAGACFRPFEAEARTTHLLQIKRRIGILHWLVSSQTQASLSALPVVRSSFRLRKGAIPPFASDRSIKICALPPLPFSSLILCHGGRFKTQKGCTECREGKEGIASRSTTTPQLSSVMGAKDCSLPAIEIRRIWRQRTRIGCWRRQRLALRFMD